jgi:death-on-curing protein
LAIEVRAIHDSVLGEYGGLPSVRDLSLLESAVMRPRQADQYGVKDMPELASKLAFGLVKNHVFVDGNKRTALVASITFLRLNGYDFDAPGPEIVLSLVAVASGKMDEEAFIGWYKEHTGKSPP